MRDLTGLSETRCRSLVGRWRRDTGEDSARVLEAIRRAEHVAPADPVAFIGGVLGRKASMLTLEAELKAALDARAASDTGAG